MKLKEIKLDYFQMWLKDETYKKYDNIYFFNNIINKKIKEPNECNNDDDNNCEHSNFDDNNGQKELSKIDEYLNILRQSFQNQNLIDLIFYPNKATQKQLSTKGTEIDIMALIIYSKFPFQEPMFYLEEKGGMIKDYSITVIIDNSKSCLSSFNEKHSYLTIINLLKIIDSLSIPYFDLIVTGEFGYFNKKPNILLSCKPSNNILKNNSAIQKLLRLLSNPILNTDLANAIKTVYKLKKNKNNKTDNYLFILTDGLSYKKDEDKIFYFLNKCQNIGIKIIGIG